MDNIQETDKNPSQPEPTSQQGPTDVPVDILKQFQLTPEDVAQMKQNAEQEELTLKKLKQEGHNLFLRFTTKAMENNPNIFPKILDVFDSPENEFEVRVNSAGEAPDEFMRQVQTQLDPGSSIQASKYLRRARSYMRGFGLEALKRDDLIATINAFDAISVNGLADNKEFTDLINDKFRDNKEMRLKVAQLVQKRQNSKKPPIKTLQPDKITGPTDPIKSAQVAQLSRTNTEQEIPLHYVRDEEPNPMDLPSQSKTEPLSGRPTPHKTTSASQQPTNVSPTPDMSTSSRPPDNATALSNQPEAGINPQPVPLIGSTIHTNTPQQEPLSGLRAVPKQPDNKSE